MSAEAPLPIPTASAGESAMVFAEVLAPIIAKGVIRRRPAVTDLADRLDADRRAVRRLQALRDRHGATTVGLRVPGRDLAVVLSPEHVRLVLDGTPEPFAAATQDKVAALSHFQPGGVLVSHGAERAERRAFNEAVLDTDRPRHRCADDIVERCVEEAERSAALAARVGTLDHDGVSAAWWRAVRRVVLGDGAADDHRITDQLAALRDAANWAWARPRAERLRTEFDRRLAAHLAAAEPGSLAALIAATPAGEHTAPEQQVPQWLFAFDAAGITLTRTLALLAAHPAELDAVRAEAAGDPTAPDATARTRAALLEAVRLWPTTPAILRQATGDAPLGDVVVPTGTELVIHTPFLHRDDATLPEANRFAPELWLDDRAPEQLALVPFSAGPARCAGRDLVLLTTAAFVGAIVRHVELELLGPPLDPLPATLSPFRIRLAAHAR